MARKRAINVPHWNSLASLVEGLQAPHWLTRSRSAEAIGNCGPDAAAAIPALRQALHDEHREVRRDAALAFGKLGELAVPAIGDLIALLDDPDVTVKWAAIDALQEIGTPAVNALINELGNQQHAQLAEMILSRIGIPAVDALLPSLANASPGVRTRVVWVLYSIAPDRPDAITALLTIARDSSASKLDRFLAVSTLKSLGEEAAKGIDVEAIYEEIFTRSPTP